MLFVATLKRDGASGADRGVEVSPSGATYFRCAAKVGKDAPKGDCVPLRYSPLAVCCYVVRFVARRLMGLYRFGAAGAFCVAML